MNIYEARWNNAVRIAEKVNKYIQEGYLILDGDGEIISKEFIISEDEILLPYGDNCHIFYFDKDVEHDDGMHTTIEEYNKQFKDWKVIHPKHFKKI